jgi:hypothetical protein
VASALYQASHRPGGDDERGEPIQLGFQDWDAIHRSGLDNRRMPAGCRAAMTKFEKE